MRSFSSIECSATGKPRTITRPRPRHHLLVDLARGTVDVGVADVLAFDGVAGNVADRARGSPRGPARCAVTAGRRGLRRSAKSAPTHAMGSCTCSVWIDVLMRSLLSDDGMVRSRAACALAASVMKPASVPALTNRNPSPTNSVSSSRSRIPAIPKILLVCATRLRHRAHRVEEGLVAELAEDPHLRGEVVRAHHHHVEPRYRGDLVGPRDRRRASPPSPPRWSGHRRRRAAPAGASAVAVRGVRARRPTGDRGAGSGRRRRSAPPRRASRRAARSHPSHPMSRHRVRYWWSCAGTRTSGVMPAPIAPEQQQRRGFERDGGVLEVDVDRVEPGRRRDHRDVGGPGLRQRHAEHELTRVDPLAHRGHGLNHGRSPGLGHSPPDVGAAGTLIPRSAYLKIWASRSVAGRPTRVTVSTSGDSARSAATVHCSRERLANGSKW